MIKIVAIDVAGDQMTNYQLETDEIVSPCRLVEIIRQKFGVSNFEIMKSGSRSTIYKEDVNTSSKEIRPEYYVPIQKVINLRIGWGSCTAVLDFNPISQPKLFTEWQAETIQEIKLTILKVVREEVRRQLSLDLRLQLKQMGYDDLKFVLS